jgi:DNA-directed RNA polymerase subunit omega
MSMARTFPSAALRASREFSIDGRRVARCFCRFSFRNCRTTMRDDYIKEALKAINDPNILINVVSRRVKQLKRGNRPLVESLEKLSPEDTALREIIEGKISHELA